MLPDLSFLFAILLGLASADGPPGSVVRALAGTMAALLVAVGATRLMAERIVQRLQEEREPPAALGALPSLVLPAFAAWWVALQWFGWGGFAFSLLPPTTWLLRYVVLFAPLLIAYATAWAARGRVEGTIATLLGRSGPAPRAWESVRTGLRRNGLALIPLGVLLGLEDGLQLLAGWGVPGVGAVLATLTDVPPAGVSFGLLVLSLLAYLLPLALARLLPSEPLPPGEVRRRLERLAEALHLKYREMRLWKTGGRGLNAMVVGLTGRTRRIFITDGLLAALAPDEVDAVFCHEAAHAKRHHLPWFLLLTGLVSLAQMLGADLLQTWGIAPFLQSLLYLAVLWFVVLGWVSRRFERESDVDGGAHAALLEPGAPDQAVPSLPRPVPAGAWRMVRALKRLESLVGNVHSHRHGSLAARAAFVAVAATHPELDARFRTGMWRLRALFVLLAVVLVSLSLRRLPDDLALGRARADVRRAGEDYRRAFVLVERQPDGAVPHWQAAWSGMRAAATSLAGRNDPHAVAERAVAWLKAGDAALRGLHDLGKAREGFERALEDLESDALPEEAAAPLRFEALVDLARVAQREGRPLAEVEALERRADTALAVRDGEEGRYGRARLRLLAGTLDLAQRDRPRGRLLLEELARGTSEEERWVELRRDAAEELARSAPR